MGIQWNSASATYRLQDDSVRWDVLHNILTEFGSMKLGTLIHMHLN